MIADLPHPPAQVSYQPLFIEIRHLDQSKPGLVRFIARMLAKNGYRPREYHALTVEEARHLGIIA